ncbi:hypothetical protein R6Q59_020893 [Mikania micrantha]|uniref:Uncharacterized protein n=1 Tax=Mikania micrantha TaxID=192012 RepID=A0A5N6PZL1_9ASTR|nr:hypothetical protein E3N88_00006 [Mikania micrantha]
MEPYPDSLSKLWFEPPLATNRRRTPQIDPVFLIILIPVLILIFIFFFLPPLLSHASHILKPGSVKFTWDSLNIFLVLFAILCGVMARKNDDVSSSGDTNGSVAESGNGVQHRFSDDFDVDMYYRNHSQRIENLHRSTPGVHMRLRRSEEDPVDFSDVKDISVDTFVVRQNSPEFGEQSLLETPPLPASAPSFHSKMHSFQRVAMHANIGTPTNIETEDRDKTRSDSRPPPLPPPELRVHQLHHKHKTFERKVSDVGTVISSLYNQRKAKNKWKRRRISGSPEMYPLSVNSVRSPEIEVPPQSLAPPPPPPPPPPPLSVFQNLFKKGGKHKRINSVPAIVPPPPPPPPPPRRSSIFNNIFKSGSKTKRFNYINSTSSPPPPPLPLPLPPPMTPQRHTVPVKSEQLSIPKNLLSTKPPLPTKTISYYDRENFPTSGSQSPLIPMPPPPPPFKIPAMKFELRGDYVKIRSTHSSVCSSPDHDDINLSSTVMDGGDLIGPVSGLISFPSPDVNAKADSFISRLKDEWRMEKRDYMCEIMG